MNHVSTQMQYALIPLVGCIIGYIVAGYTKNWAISLIVGLVVVLLEIHAIKWNKRRKNK